MSNNDEKILEKYKKIAQKEKQEIIYEPDNTQSSDRATCFLGNGA